MIIHDKCIMYCGLVMKYYVFILQFTTSSVSKAVNDLRNHVSTKQAPVVEGDDGDLDGILNRLSLNGKQQGAVCE